MVVIVFAVILIVIFLWMIGNNDAVLEFNNRREVFPNNLVAGMFGFMPGKALEIADIQSKREAVVVKF